MLNTKRWKVIGILLLVIGAVGAIFTYPSMADTEQVTEEHQFDEEITAVTVDSDNSRLEFFPSADNTTRVEFELPGNQKQRYNLAATVEDGVLKVEANEKILQFFSFGFNFDSFVTSVYLPEEMYDSIIAETSNGAIVMEEISASTVEAASTNGAVIFDRLDVESVTANATNGTIEFIDVHATLHAETTNGRINLQTDSIEHPIDFETTNGKINIVVDQIPENAEIRANVTNGSVDVFGEDSSFRTFGNGDISINLKTVNGSITVSDQE
jgi:HSP20 family molecular chaperone IbpA